MLQTSPMYAPAFRLGHEASHVVVNWIFGGALLALVVLAAALSWRAWVSASALRAEVWRARGLHAGVVLVAGVAEPVEEERDAATRDAAAIPPFVELTIHQHGTQHSSRNGKHVQWKEVSRSMSERPFVVRTDAGTRIRVEPTGHIDLVDKLEEPLRRGNDRRRIARIIPGERVWIRGELVVDAAAHGPYRGGAHEPTLRPPADRPLLICSQPVEAEQSGNARFHGAFALAFFVVLVVCQAFVFSRYRALLHGVEQTAHITSVRTWETRSKNSVTDHYAFSLAPMGVEAEVGVKAYMILQAGDTVPVMRGATDPSIVQIGPAHEVGVDTGPVTLASILAGGTLLAWLLIGAHRRPWWRRARFDETESGTL